MSKKKSKIFLWVGLAWIALSVILTLMYIVIGSIKEIADGSYPQEPSWVYEFALFCIMFCVLPLLALKAVCVRSVYKLLEYDPKGYVKVLYIISAIITFLTLVLMLLVYTGCIKFDDNIRNKIIYDVITLRIGWPVAILSFILSSIRSKEEVASKCSDDDSKKGG